MATPTRTPITTAGLSAPGSTVKALVQIATKPDRLSPGYVRVLFLAHDVVISFIRFSAKARCSGDVFCVFLMIPCCATISPSCAQNSTRAKSLHKIKCLAVRIEP